MNEERVSHKRKRNYMFLVVCERERELTLVLDIMPYTPSRLHVKGAILGYRR